MHATPRIPSLRRSVASSVRRFFLPYVASSLLPSVATSLPSPLDITHAPTKIYPMDLIYYPVTVFDYVMKGAVIGGMGIVHVFIAQFAIGGGFLLLYFEWLAQRRGMTLARVFLDSYFKALVLISFVAGALTGVGMWFTTIQISPRTIGLMVDEFHWFWATEWTFFCLEVVSGYTFYRYRASLGGRQRLALLALYSFAAWMSLFWINGILSWQLTPGEWSTSHNAWAGFFNPSFWPSLFFRTVVAITIASLGACIVINTMKLERDARAELIHVAARPLICMAAMPVLAAWFVAVVPNDSRAWILGGSPAMTLFMMMAVGASVAIGLYALIGLIREQLYINGATATLLAGLAFVATAGGEFVREGVRKPFTVREALYSNAITPDEVARMRAVGSTTHDPYPLRDADAYPTDQTRLGARVFRVQCSICHTLEGMNGLSHLAGTWTTEQKRMNIAKLQMTKPFMPPFAGTAEEVEALVQLLEWQHAGRPDSWSGSSDPDAVSRIQTWLDEAGTESMVAARASEGREPR